MTACPKFRQLRSRPVTLAPAISPPRQQAEERASGGQSSCAVYGHGCEARRGARGTPEASPELLMVKCESLSLDAKNYEGS